MKLSMILITLGMLFSQLGYGNEPSQLLFMLSQELTLRSARSSAALGEERLLSQVREALEKGANPNHCAEKSIGLLTQGDCPIHYALMLGDAKVVRELVQSGANTNAPKPLPPQAKGVKAPRQLTEILTPRKMLAFRKKIALDRKSAIEKHLQENPVSESERKIIQGRAMPTRLESDLQNVITQIAQIRALEEALVK